MNMYLIVSNSTNSNSKSSLPDQRSTWRCLNATQQPLQIDKSFCKSFSLNHNIIFIVLIWATCDPPRSVYSLVLLLEWLQFVFYKLSFQPSPARCALSFVFSRLEKSVYASWGVNCLLLTVCLLMTVPLITFLSISIHLLLQVRRGRGLCVECCLVKYCVERRWVWRFYRLPRWSKSAKQWRQLPP